MRFGLVMGEAASGLRRNISMVISVILVTFISLTFVGAAILLQLQIVQMKGYWYDRAQVAVYLCTASESTGNCTEEEATPEQIAAVEAQLKSPDLDQYIEKYAFEDHALAYKNFQTFLGDSSYASFVKPEMLNESFRVNLKDPNNADVLIESLSGYAGVQAVEDQRKYLDQIFGVLNAASYTAIGLAGKTARFPHELSGGEQQRVAIARAIVNKPAILLADEPTGNLDPATSQGIMTLLERINLGGTTVVMATHDAGIVDSMKRRVIELIGGQIVRDEKQGGYQTQSMPIQTFGLAGSGDAK